MTSYPFIKMAAATAKYYFRFHICWCHCLPKVKIYLQTKFRQHISIHGPQKDRPWAETRHLSHSA